MNKIIAVISGKGGVGKTTVTACVGAALAAKGHQVLVADGDLGLRDLDLVLGQENDILFDAVDVWKERCDADHAILNVAPNLDFLPASQSRRWEDLGRKGYGKLLRRLSQRYEYIIVDAPAGIGRGNEAVLRAADEMLLVTAPLWVAIRDAQRVMQLCHEQRRFNYAVVVNSVGAGEADLSVPEALSALQAERVGAILPYRTEVITAAQQGALHQLTDGPFATQMADLVTYLETEEPVPEEELLAHWDAYAASVQPKAPMQSMLSAVTESAKKGLAGLLRHRRNSPWRHRLR